MSLPWTRKSYIFLKLHLRDVQMRICKFILKFYQEREARRLIYRNAIILTPLFVAS